LTESIKSTYFLLFLNHGIINRQLHLYRRDELMRNYYLTVFEKNGKLLVEKSFEAASNDEAKNEAFNFLTHKGYAQHTHRCVSDDAKLLLFHR